MKTITLTPSICKNVVTNYDGRLVIPDVTNYKVGYKLIWIEYNGGESIIAVKRSDFTSMVVNDRIDVLINGEGFERINCDTESCQEF